MELHMDDIPLSAGRARTLMADIFAERLAADFAEHVDDVVETIRRENPVAYLRFAAFFVPRHVPPRNPLADISDSELDAMIQNLRAAIAAEAGSARKVKR
jgi:hypothetical protein